MGNLIGVVLGELREYLNPEDPPNSDYIVGLPMTVKEGVVTNPETGETLDVTLDDIETNKADKDLSNVPDSAFTAKALTAGVRGIIAKTYSEISEIKSSHSLTPGCLYEIIDYATKYIIPYTNTIKTTTPESLIVQAISTEQLSRIAYSSLHPGDIIYYDFDDNVCEDGLTQRNGFILRRIDTINSIDAPQDWRNMVWARYRANGKNWVGGEVLRQEVYENDGKLYITIRSGVPLDSYDTNYFQELGYTINDYVWSSEVYPGMILNGYAERYTFNYDTSLTKIEATAFSSIVPECIKIESTVNDANKLHNNVWQYDGDSRPVKIMLGSGCHSNTFGKECDVVTFEANCHSNTFKQKCFITSFGTGCNSNIFGSECFGNVFAGDNYRNIFSDKCFCNSFSANCFNNIFGYENHINTFGANCHSNSLGKNSKANTLGSGANNLKCGEDFSYNMAGSGFNNNTFGDFCFYNVFGSDFGTNVLGIDCQNNTFGSNCIYNTFGNGFKFNTVKYRIHAKNMTEITELYYKDYNHDIFSTPDGSVKAVHYVGTVPVYTSIP